MIFSRYRLNSTGDKKASLAYSDRCSKGLSLICAFQWVSPPEPRQPESSRKQLPSLHHGEVGLTCACTGRQLPSRHHGEVGLTCACTGRQLPSLHHGEVGLTCACTGHQLPSLHNEEVGFTCACITGRRG